MCSNSYFANKANRIVWVCVYMWFVCVCVCVNLSRQDKPNLHKFIRFSRQHKGFRQACLNLAITEKTEVNSKGGYFSSG